MPNTNERDALTDVQMTDLIEESGGQWREDEFRINGADLAKLLRAAATAPNAGAPLAPEFDVRKILLAVVPGVDGMGHEIYAKSVADVEKVLTEQDEKLENWELGILLYNSDAAPAQQAGAPLPLAPIDEERGDRVLLTVIRRQQLDEGLDPTCGYVKALDRAIERLATPPQATLPASEPDLGLMLGDHFHKRMMESTDQSVTEPFKAWLDSVHIRGRQGVGSNEAWNAGVAYALATRAQPQADAAEPVAKGGK